MMKLEYISDANVGGTGDDLVRLFHFTQVDIQALAHVIQSNMLGSKQPVQLHGLTFIQPLNCELQFMPSESDQGITMVGQGKFTCRLTARSWGHVLELIDPFVQNSSSGFQWLYNLENCRTELLLSANGQW